MLPVPAIRDLWSDLFVAWNDTAQQPEDADGWAVFMLHCDRLETLASEHGIDHIAAALAALTTRLERIAVPTALDSAEVAALMSPLAEAVRSSLEFSGPVRRLPTSRSGERHPLVMLLGTAAGDPQEALDRIVQFGYRMEAVADAALGAARCAAKKALLAVIDVSAGFDTAVEQAIAVLERGGIAWCVLSSSGDYELRLQAVRRGARFFFVAPLDAEALVRLLDPIAFPVQEEPYRVLALDDSRTALAAVRKALQPHAGIQLGTLSQAHKVLDVLQQFVPDVLLLDFHMRGCTGIEVAQIIRQHTEFESVPIIYLTGESSAHVQRAASRHGGDDFLVKPVADDLLADTVIHKAERYRRLRRLMEEDSLTGLYNHGKTKSLVQQFLTQAERETRPMSYALLDIDRFKQVNDTHGHGAGDQVITALARHLRQHLRASDLIGRYGGEEFAVVLYDCPAVEAAQLIDRIRSTFCRLRHGPDSARFTCSFSAGVAQFPSHASVCELMAAADRALYAAKRAGRDQVVVDGEAAPGFVHSDDGGSSLSCSALLKKTALEPAYFRQSAP